MEPPKAWQEKRANGANMRWFIQSDLEFDNLIYAT
jgi:hypothetical protein